MNKSIFQNISFTLASNVWLTVAMLVCSTVYIALIGIESYRLIGFYTTLLAITGIIDSGFSSTAAREIASMRSDQKEIKKIKNLFFSLEIIYWPTILTVIALIYLSFVATQFSWVQSETLSQNFIQDSISLMLGLVIFQVASGLYMNALIGFQKHIAFASIAAMFGTIRTFGVLPFLYLYEDVRVFFIWQIVWAIIQVCSTKAILSFEFKKISNLRAKFSLQALLKIRTYLGGMFIITILSLAVSQIDKVILSKMLSLEEFGYYMLAFTVALSLSRLTTPIIQVYWPQFSALSSDTQKVELGSRFLECFEILSIAIIPFFVLIVIYSEPLLLLWTNNYDITMQANSLLMVLIFGTTLSSLSFPALIVLYARGVLAFVICSNLAILILISVALFLLIPKFGSISAAYSYSAYGLAMFFLFTFKALSQLKINSSISTLIQKIYYPSLVSILVAGAFFYPISISSNKILLSILFLTQILLIFTILAFSNKKILTYLQLKLG